MPTDTIRWWGGVGEPSRGRPSGREHRGARIQTCPTCDRQFSMENPTASGPTEGLLQHRPNCWWLARWNDAVAAGIVDPTGTTPGGDGGGSGPPAVGTATWGTENTAWGSAAAPWGSI